MLVPDFYLDPTTKLLSCFTRAWADIEEDRLVADIEAKMRIEPKTKEFIDSDFWKQHVMTDFLPKITIDSLSDSHVHFTHYVKKDASATGRLHDKMKDLVRNMPSPRMPVRTLLRGKRPDQIIFDSEISYKELELRTLAMLNQHKRDAAGLGDLMFTVLKNRDHITSCRTTISEPSPQLPIFRPSSPASTASVARASVIPRLLADSVSKSPPSTGG